MTEFTPSKKTAQDFNGGVEYVDGDAEAGIFGDAIQAETINNLVESALYSQNVVEQNTADMQSGIEQITAIANTATSTADSALSVANEAKITADGLDEQIQSANETAQEALDRIDEAISNNVLPNGTYPDMTVGTANSLSTSRAIDGVPFDGTSDINHYASCSTAASTQAKVVAKTDFTLSVGARITVEFTYANTTNSPTLNVNSTGAKAIKADGDTVYVKWNAGAIMDFVYNGTYWVVMNGYALKGMRVGKVYTSHDSTSPATLYGGSWTAIGEGRSIVGYGITNNPSYKGNFSLTTQYYANDIVLRYGYGTYYVCKKDVLGQNVTQTEYWAVYEPGYQGGATSHTHESGSLYAKWGISTGSQEMHFVLKNADKTWTGYTRGISVTSKNDASWGEALDTGGSTAAGSSMPPYIVEYRWKRTA